jgi:hypothetical protein
MGTVRILFPLPTRSMNTQRPSRCWMCPHSSAANSLRRRAQPKSTARITRARFAWFRGRAQRAGRRLFPGEPVPCPGAGLADALQGQDSLGRAAIKQSVFGRFCGQLADRREPEIDGGRRQAGRLQNPPVLLNDRSAKWRSGFRRVPGPFVGVLGMRGADGVDGEGGDGTPIWISGRNRDGEGIIRHVPSPARPLWFPEPSRSGNAPDRGGKSENLCQPPSGSFSGLVSATTRAGKSENTCQPLPAGTAADISMGSCSRSTASDAIRATRQPGSPAANDPESGSGAPGHGTRRRVSPAGCGLRDWL